MKSMLFLFSTLFLAMAASAQVPYAIRDGQGRHVIPRGFVITVGETVVIYNPLKNVGLEVIDPGIGSSPAEFIWDPYRQQLVVLKWPVDQETFRVTVQPGICQEILPPQ